MPTTEMSVSYILLWPCTHIGHPVGVRVTRKDDDVVDLVLTDMI
jgi:hypothetical protein